MIADAVSVIVGVGASRFFDEGVGARQSCDEGVGARRSRDEGVVLVAAWAFVVSVTRG